jgi:hypothetical protein
MRNHYALIISSTNVVENIIVADDTFDPGVEYYMRRLEDRPEIGWVHDTKTDTFSPSSAPPAKTVELAADEVVDLVGALSRSGLDPARIAEIQRKLEADQGASAAAAAEELVAKVVTP